MAQWLACMFPEIAALDSNHSSGYFSEKNSDVAALIDSTLDSEKLD